MTDPIITSSPFNVQLILSFKRWYRMACFIRRAGVATTLNESGVA
jgi:hypothetical protein